MSFRITALALAAAVTISAPAFAADALTRVQAHLRAVDTMVADFAQTDQNGKTLTGTLTLKRPGKIRFQYQKGVPLLIVGDGKALTMIDYQVAQVSRWPIGNSPLAILLDPSSLSRVAHAIPAPPGRILIEGRDSKHPELGTITIGFSEVTGAPAGLIMAGWTVLDAQGNRSTVVLTNPRFNTAVNDRTFLWRDPRPQTRGK